VLNPVPSATSPSGALRACLFDLDGVLTATAVLHAAAWKEMFDAFLAAYAERTGTPQRPFDAGADYQRYVDGRPRLDGIRTFLASREIPLPDGGPGDPDDAWTVFRLGETKNAEVVKRIQAGEVQVYAGSVGFVDAARKAGLRTAVVSSSANTRDVLRAVGIEHLFDVRIDGLVARERGLPGKPAPDTFLAGARELGVRPEQAVVFEDALAGVEAGRAGGFGLVVGVDRVGPDHARALREHGADVVVGDLSELDAAKLDAAATDAAGGGVTS
jgi:beta-phosphoglucomutase family hydrolase